MIETALPGAQLAIAPLPRIANYPRTRDLQLTFPPGAQPAQLLPWGALRVISMTFRNSAPARGRPC